MHRTRSIKYAIYEYLTPYVDPWVTTGQYYYSRRTRVHLHYSCIKYVPQASTVTHVIAQPGSDRPISGSPGRKNQKKKHKIMQNVPPYVFLPRIQPRDLLHFAFSLSFRSFILTSSLSLFLYLRPPSPLPLLQLSPIYCLHSFIPFCYSPPSLSLVWFFFSAPSHRRHPFIMGLLSSRFLRIPRPEVCY